MMNTKRFINNFPTILTPSSGDTFVVTRDCDACSPIMAIRQKPSHLNHSTFFFNIFSSQISSPLDSYHTTLLSPFFKEFAVLNASALQFLRYFDVPHSISDIPVYWTQAWGKTSVRSTLEQMIDIGLILPEDTTVEPELCETSPATLAAWLHLTNCCNLRCSYCYLPNTDENMFLKTGKAAIDAAFRSATAHGYQQVKFKYAGGESLLRFKLVKALHEYANYVAERHKLKLDGVVLSNGTLLTKPIIKKMQALKLRLTVSFDHLPSSRPHQKGAWQRCYPDGRDASAEAKRGIELALECGLIPNISITVSGKNVHTLPELLNWLLVQEIPFSLNFYRPQRNFESDDLRFKEREFIAGMLTAYKVIEDNLPNWSLLASLADLVNFASPHLRRCSVGHSYLVFDCLGRVSKCQMQMEQPLTDVYTDDPLAEIRKDTCGIQNLTFAEKEGCQDCKWRYWCAGGCPLETYRRTGRYDLKSPNCEIYKALYPEILRLEGLRLLKVGT